MVILLMGLFYINITYNNNPALPTHGIYSHTFLLQLSWTTIGYTIPIHFVSTQISQGSPKVEQLLHQQLFLSFLGFIFNSYVAHRREYQSVALVLTLEWISFEFLLSNSTSLHPPPLHGRGKLLCFQSLQKPQVTRPSARSSHFVSETP